MIAPGRRRTKADEGGRRHAKVGVGAESAGAWVGEGVREGGRGARAVRGEQEGEHHSASELGHAGDVAVDVVERDLRVLHPSAQRHPHLEVSVRQSIAINCNQVQSSAIKCNQVQSSAPGSVGEAAALLPSERRRCTLHRGSCTGSAAAAGSVAVAVCLAGADKVAEARVGVLAVARWDAEVLAVAAAVARWAAAAAAQAATVAVGRTAAVATDEAPTAVAARVAHHCRGSE